METREDFIRCFSLGFDLFQGYYFAKPSLMEKKRLCDSTSTMLKLMRLLDADADLAEIEQCIRGSAGLTYKLLLLVNSVGVGARRKIDTVRHAVTMIGRHQIRRWVQLALFADDDHRGLENPLLEMAAVRATVMEHLACQHPGLGKDVQRGDKAFMVGILSILDSVYHLPMDDVLQNLNLSEEIREALVHNGGEYGALLQMARQIEAMDFDTLLLGLNSSGLSLQHLLKAQASAYAWRSQVH